jgi:hypothetical protein
MNIAPSLPFTPVRSLILLWSALALGLPSPAAEPKAPAPEAAPKATAATPPALDHETLSRLMANTRAALGALQPVKNNLTARAERLKAEYQERPSESLQALIRANETRLDEVRDQERKIRRTMAALEEKIAELKQDPVEAAMIEATEKLKRAREELERAGKLLPKEPQ